MRRVTGLLLCLAVLAGAGMLAHRQGWIAGGLSAVKGEARAAPEARQAPRIPVEVAVARQEQVTSDIRSIGTLQSDESVKVASEVAGRIERLAFKEGEQVQTGAVLVQLDAALVKASLEESEARLELAKANYDRAQRLQQSGSGTARALDEAKAELNTASALIDSQRVQISKHTISAPFDGVVGLRSVSVGAYIPIGTALVNLEKIDVLKVDFKVPEIFLRQIGPGQNVEIAVDAMPDRSFTGTIYAIDPMVDVNGRSISVRANLPNPDLVLRPGLFVRVVVKGLDSRPTVFVPESAIVPRGQERFVWLVADGKAKETKVELGRRRAGEVEILKGVAVDASVVVAGQGRLRNGATVEVVPTPPATQS
ncbi:efflux RND transporter periplasmic adaptor subunit [Ancylobacter defluvii]|uniref:MexH family multidrug efflux RND transporter periplasmic adaptor subunit n=1 Tax=Ancylobacter defluvii TaxID=1282440 RepID=A0A9W6NC08_9HYPH|nr:efflux RND transporter periplasmic adaptor subunit [Ancylobacter defluvii]MBS7589459.1 efflux RND transporter periplasmic adaptor subunit [Ancylobacter defluvii]GLK85076.1 MexH family multidrug efflux RND transporter periplasmic adaptor subunit [Ancylobacter defluvii]